VEWVRVEDKDGKFENSKVNNRTWQNWLRIDRAKAHITFYNVID
jgi:hypothetical protein